MTVFDFHFVIDDVEKTPVGVHLRLAPVGLAPLFHLKTPVDAEDGAQHLEAPASQRHLVDLKVTFVCIKNDFFTSFLRILYKSMIGKIDKRNQIVFK